MIRTDPFLTELLRYLARDNWAYFRDGGSPLPIHFIVADLEPAMRVRGEIISPQMFLDAKQGTLLPEAFLAGDGNWPGFSFRETESTSTIHLQNVQIQMCGCDWDPMPGPMRITSDHLCCVEG